ncbi:CYFA0S40e00144g1_1 [Cyberlindnera fabianii]|uniref:CYFA0S40e00144g1_1 n=1 Tax=Cyberlindnera fabianii TaxID=36022 RepID=A0A061BEX5_CYBFA|nr:CYFA0S40e00144g1_1 [Cyberlindnera fabianii]
MSDPVDFDIIEQHKENIEPQKDGRSASALKGILQVPKTELKKQQLDERREIEKQLELLDELDDPIQPFLDYIDWSIKNFPSGRSVESGLLPLLERCTSHFKDDVVYKNDPRFLKVWLQYVKYSENPRDIFVYLARKEIGRQLALYYEEYANYYEGIGRDDQATLVYEEGIRQEARPLTRLQRRFNEFHERKMKRPTISHVSGSPVFPTRTALALKSGTSVPVFQDDKRPIPQNKIDIFNDEEESTDLRTGGWDRIQTEQLRNKENKMSAISWAGETLPQDTPVTKKKFTPKVAVFKDTDTLHQQVYKIIEVPGKKPEKIDLNFDLLYQGEEEYCLQEVLAMMRGAYTKPQSAELTPSLENVSVSLVKADKQRENNETIHLNPLNNLKRRASPTATLYTKEANDEVYSMFNRGSKTVKSDNYEDDELIYDDLTEQITRPVLNDLTERVDQKKRKLEEENENLGAIIQKKCIVAPADEKLKVALLSELNPSLNSYRGFFQYPKTMNMCNTLKKSLNIKQSRHVFVEFEGTGDPYNLKTLLGEGGFASVYLAESMTGEIKAIKCQKPSSAWEFYILTQIHKRLEGDQVLESIVVPDELHYYDDESYLIIDYIEKGTVLDIVNLYRAAGKPVDEVLVVFITCELLKVLESIHGVGIMHGDLKADNCMLRFGSSHDNVDAKSWKDRGIKLIDFGRSIDMTLFPKNVEFKCNWKTDSQDCPEMRNKETWTFQADYFGIAAIIHTMLYGTFIETKFDGTKYVLASPIKRYWKQELWNPLFDFLMNSKSYGTLPLTNVLKSHRQRLESWIEDNDQSLVSILKYVKDGLK